MYRGGHVEKRRKAKRAGSSFETRFPNYPDSSEKPAFTGVIWEKARPQIACPAVIYPRSFRGRKGGREGGREAERELPRISEGR